MGRKGTLGRKRKGNKPWGGKERKGKEGKGKEKEMKGKQNMLFGLTNDAFGYILTKVDFHSFKRYNYISETSLGEMTGEIYIEQALQMVAVNPIPVPK